MGARKPVWRTARLLFIFSGFFFFISGCQMAYIAPRAKLVEHLEQVDDRGLAEQMDVPDLKTSAAIPNGWQALPLQKTALYTHQQWRSPSRRTAVGVTYVRMPLPLSTKTLVWFATNEAGKRSNDGKIIRQWSDGLGREWFEAENTKYHMVGYVLTRGFDAWINYCGYRVMEEKEPKEIEIGNRSLETILPVSAKAARQPQATASAE